MLTSTKQSTWNKMAEALFVDYPRRLQEGNRMDMESLSDNTIVLSESIVVNGNHFIPANTTLHIDQPAERS